jgi:hypothetical protein
MMHDPIIFDPKLGCVYARFSLRRWYWGIVLSISMSLMIRPGPSETACTILELGSST